MTIKNIEKKKDATVKQTSLRDQLFETIILIMEEKPDYIIPSYWYYFAIIMNTFQKSGYTFNTQQSKIINQENLFVIAKINEFSTISYLISTNKVDILTYFAFYLMNGLLLSIFLYIIILTFLRRQHQYAKKYKQKVEQINRILYIFITFYPWYLIVPIFEINIGMISCNSNSFIDSYQNCSQPVYLLIIAGISIPLAFLLNFLTFYFTRSYEFQDTNQLRRKFNPTILGIFILQFTVMLFDFMYTQFETLKYYIFHLQNLMTLYDILQNHPFRDKVISALYNLQFSYCVASSVLLQIWLRTDYIEQYDIFYSFFPLASLVFFLTLSLQNRKYESLTKITTNNFEKYYQSFDFYLEELFLSALNYLKNEESKVKFCELINYHKNNCQNTHCCCHQQNYQKDKITLDFDSVCELIEDLFVWCLNQPIVINNSVVFMNICLRYISFISKSKNNSLKSFYHLQQYFHKQKNIDYYSSKIFIVLAKNIQSLNEIENLRFQQKNISVREELDLKNVQLAEDFKETIVPMISDYLMKKRELFHRLQSGYDNLQLFAKDAKEFSLQGIKIINTFYKKQLSFEHETKQIAIQMKVSSLFYCFVQNNIRKSIDLEYEIKQTLKKELGQKENMISNLNFVRGKIQNFQVSISGNKGKIMKNYLSTNQLVRLSNYFGYAPQEFRKVEHINDLIPSFISEFHTNLIDSAIESGNVNVIFNQKQTFGKSKQNLLIPIKIQILSCPQVYNNFEFLVSILKVKSNSEYIIFGDTGQMLGFTERAYRNFFREPIKKKQKQIQIGQNAFQDLKLIKKLNKLASYKIFQNYEVQSVYKHFNLFLICQDILDVIFTTQSNLTHLDEHEQQRELDRLNKHIMEQRESFKVSQYISVNEQFTFSVPYKIVELSTSHKHSIIDDPNKSSHLKNQFYMNTKKFLQENYREYDQKMCISMMKSYATINKISFLYTQDSKEVIKSYYTMEITDFKTEKKKRIVKKEQKETENATSRNTSQSNTIMASSSSQKNGIAGSNQDLNSSDLYQNQRNSDLVQQSLSKLFKEKSAIYDVSCSNLSENDIDYSPSYKTRDFSAIDNDQPNSKDKSCQSFTNSMIDSTLTMGVEPTQLDKQIIQDMQEDTKIHVGSQATVGGGTNRRLSKFAEQATFFKSLDMIQKSNYSLSNINQELEKEKTSSNQQSSIPQLYPSKNNLLSIERSSIIINPSRLQSMLALSNPHQMGQLQGIQGLSIINKKESSKVEESEELAYEKKSEPTETNSQRQKKIKAKIRSSFRRAILANKNKDSSNFISVHVQAEQQKIFQSDRKKNIFSLQNQIDMEFEKKQKELIRQIEECANNIPQTLQEDDGEDHQTTHSEKEKIIAQNTITMRKEKDLEEDDEENEDNQSQYLKKFDYEVVHKYLTNPQKHNLSTSKIMEYIQVILFFSVCIGYLTVVLCSTSEMKSIINQKNIVKSQETLYSKQVSELLIQIFIADLKKYNHFNSFLDYTVTLMNSCYQTSLNYNLINSDIINLFSQSISTLTTQSQNISSFSNRIESLINYKSADLVMLTGYNIINVCYQDQIDEVENFSFVDGYYFLQANYNETMTLSYGLYQQIANNLNSQIDSLLNLFVIFCVMIISVFALVIYLEQRKMSKLIKFKQKVLLVISRVSLNEIEVEILKIEESLNKLRDQMDSWIAFDFVNLMVSAKKRRQILLRGNSRIKNQKRKDVQASSLIFDQQISRGIYLIIAILISVFSAAFFCGYILDNYIDVKLLQRLFNSIKQTDMGINYFSSTLVYSNLLYSYQYLNHFEPSYPQFNLTEVYSTYSYSLLNLQNFNYWINQEQFNGDIQSSSIQNDIQNIIKSNLCSLTFLNCTLIPSSVASYYSQGVSGIFSLYFTFLSTYDGLLQNQNTSSSLGYSQYLDNFYSDKLYEVLFLNGFALPLDALEQLSSLFDNSFDEKIQKIQTNSLLYFIIGGISFTLIFSCILYRASKSLKTDVEALKFSLTLIPHAKFKEEATIYMLKQLFKS